MPIIIDDPEGIEHFRRCALAHALRIEINTGMKRSGQGRSTLAIINDTFNTKFRTKKQALAFMIEEGYIRG